MILDTRRQGGGGPLMLQPPHLATPAKEGTGVATLAIAENRDFQKKEIQFFSVNALWMSFGIFVVTYGVTDFLPKLVDILLFSRKN